MTFRMTLLASLFFIMPFAVAKKTTPKAETNIPDAKGAPQMNLVGAQCTIEITTTYKSGTKNKEEYQVQAANKDDCSKSAGPFKEIAFPEGIANKSVVPRWKGK